MKRVIAIDGPSGAGKSTVARILAERLGFQYLDTGALYRAVALFLRRKGLDDGITDEQIREALHDLFIDFPDGRTLINGEDVSDEIRTPEIGHYSSVFSARRPVREFLLDIQRGYPRRHDTVVEGRDMGTVVFPTAWRKLFLDASGEERARRRYLQLKTAGKDITMEDAVKDIRERDIRDSSREIAPLKRASDALYIDTTSMDIEDTVKKIMEVL
ncbi:cytidylate kinase [bacterium BMS3Bbin06]|nr:cytidylate kinase [bacterium BMS3Abin08]GBE35413.1 cytidylate kinase [bacterium BMS3Bbin06]